MNNVIQLHTAPRPPQRVSMPTEAKAAEILELRPFLDGRARRVNPRAVRHPRLAGPATVGSLEPGDVWEALGESRLTLHYQPQYDLRTGTPIAAEALVRLIDTDGKLIYPDRFIAMAEAGDLIVPLGRAVISRVCSDLAACRAQGATIDRVAVNLAARQLQLDSKLLHFIDREIDSHGLRYEDLEFELTERQRLEPNGAGMAQLKVLAERGSRIVLDDFGMGYSSVIYLAELPISAFKMDRALVSGLPGGQPARRLLDALISLAEYLGLEVIAEGIETTEQNDFLERAGCPYGQGFGYARPMDIVDLQTWVAKEVTGADESPRADRRLGP